jgi:anaerobic magnesium-protoporphyrin IX monomethyl ester cyclase
MPAAGVRMPNGALSSLAGNVDSHHQVTVADLILVQRRVRETVVRLVDRWQPDLVGLSIMTFQRKTAQATIDLIRTLKPNVRIVVGGYDPTLATESYTGSGPGKVDFIGAISARLRERGNGVRTLPRH